MVYISFTQIIKYQKYKVFSTRSFWVAVVCIEKCLVHIYKWYSNDWIKMFDNCMLFFIFISFSILMCFVLISDGSSDRRCAEDI